MNKHIVSGRFFVPVILGLFLVPYVYAGRVVYQATEVLCPGELDYRKNRVERIKSGLTRFFGEPVRLGSKKPPTIALCLSGGGMRASLLTLGFLKAADETGLLDTCMYAASLSGSSWALSSWVASQKNVSDHLELLKGRLNLNDKARFSQRCIDDLMTFLMQRIIGFNTLSLIDVYGCLLAVLFMPETPWGNRFEVPLSQTQAHVSRAEVPMPLYTALEASTETYRWLTFTPFDVALTEDGYASIALADFGNVYRNGTTLAGLTEKSMEKSMSYCLALFGSAFALSIKDFLAHAIRALFAQSSLEGHLKIILQEVLMRIIEQAWQQQAAKSFGAARFSPARVPNFCYGLHGHPLEYIKNMVCVDAGIACNLPLQPLLLKSRHVDVIIVYDASSDIRGAPELLAAESYARAHGIPFPTIRYAGIEKRAVSVFDDPDPDVPTIIYIPRCANATYSPYFDPDECITNGYCSTFNFFYTLHEVDELSGLAYFTLKEQIGTIKRAIMNRCTSQPCLSQAYYSGGSCSRSRAF